MKHIFQQNKRLKRDNLTSVKRITCIILFLIFPILVKAQKNKLSQLICLDHLILDATFNDKIFINKLHTDTCICYFEIINIDTINGYLLYSKDKSKTEIFEIFKVDIKLTDRNIYNLPVFSTHKIWNDTLVYYLLHIGRNWYKIFGFYVTDLSYFFQEFGISGLNDLAMTLYKNKVLTRKSRRFFVNSISKRKREFDKRLKMPCSILKYYYLSTENKYINTIILPSRPLFPSTF